MPKNPFDQFRSLPETKRHSAYDRFGRILGDQDIIALDNHPGTDWQVVKSTPVLHPDAPPGSVQLMLQAMTVVVVQGGTPTQGLTRLRLAKEYLTPAQMAEIAGQAPTEVPSTGQEPPTAEDAPADGPRLVTES